MEDKAGCIALKDCRSVEEMGKDAEDEEGEEEEKGTAEHSALTNSVTGMPYAIRNAFSMLPFLSFSLSFP